MAEFFVLRFSFFFFLNFMYLGIYFLWLWRAGASHCGGFSLQGLLTAGASLIAEPGFQGTQPSVVLVPTL